jgi:hypothetical protein
MSEVKTSIDSEVGPFKSYLHPEDVRRWEDAPDDKKPFDAGIAARHTFDRKVRLSMEDLNRFERWENERPDVLYAKAALKELIKPGNMHEGTNLAFAAISAGSDHYHKISEPDQDPEQMVREELFGLKEGQDRDDISLRDRALYDKEINAARALKAIRAVQQTETLTQAEAREAIRGITEHFVENATALARAETDKADRYATALYRKNPEAFETRAMEDPEAIKAGVQYRESQE